jgi:hypothetical protein
MKYTESEIRKVVREEIENAAQQGDKPEPEVAGPGAMEIKKMKAALARIKGVMGAVIKSVSKGGPTARVNFAAAMIAPLNLQSNELTQLKTKMETLIEK